jgi:general secretion pathway protein K
VAVVTRQRGFALLIVLWTMVLLALLVAQFTTTGRTEVQMAANLRANAVTEAAADGAVFEAIMRLVQGAWAADGRLRVLRVGDAAIEVRVTNQSRKVNPNTASAPVIQALLGNLGVDAGKAAALARAIVDWRSTSAQSLSGGTKLSQYQAAGLPYGPANQLFDNVDDLGLVIGMTPALLNRMKPFLSIYREGDPQTPADLPVTVEQASAAAGDGWYFGSSGRVMVVVIDASSSGAKGGRFTRQAVVRLRAEASLDQAPYQILTWGTPSE